MSRGEWAACLRKAEWGGAVGVRLGCTIAAVAFSSKSRFCPASRIGSTWDASPSTDECACARPSYAVTPWLICGLAFDVMSDAAQLTAHGNSYFIWPCLTSVLHSTPATYRHTSVIIPCAMGCMLFCPSQTPRHPPHSMSYLKLRPLPLLFQVPDPDTRQFLMFYEAIAADGSRSIGLATSQDGRGSWQRQPAPLLTPSQLQEAWDGGSVGAPCAVPMSAGRWRLYYAGRGQREGPWEGIGVALGGREEGSLTGPMAFKRRTGRKE